MIKPGSIRGGPKTRSLAAPDSPVRRVPLRLLSSGRDGSALLARAIDTGKLVELRHATVANTDPERWAAIDRAAQVYALLTHPSFRKLEARELANGAPVLVFASYCEADLTGRLQAGPLSAEEACRLGKPIAHALSLMHKLGLAHRSLGPSAVQLHEKGTPLLDFAWLDLGAPKHELDLACEPPELGREPLDASSDIYAFGKLLQVMLLGRVPVAGDERGFPAFEALIRDCTQSERDTRPSIEEVCAELEGLLPVDTLPLALLAEHWSIPANENVRLSLRAAVRGSARVRPRLISGTLLGRFELLRKLGEGGMGEVFEAVDRATGERAALKVLHARGDAKPEQLKRFRKEARILSEIRNPQIANLIECNRDAGVDFMALELVLGGNLAQWLVEQGGRIHEVDVLAILADICRGLSEAHARGIVHRDIKPQNVMIDRFADFRTDGEMRVKLCDFGIARALENRGETLSFTEHDRVLGTPDFMAPEQISGGLVTPATDVYALGVLAFQLLVGRLPFESSSAFTTILAQAAQPAPPLAAACADVSEATASLVDRMLKKPPEDRFADASLLLEAIERIQRGEPVPSQLHPVRPSAAPGRVVQHAQEWQLRASAQALWPFVSDTDRLNRALGQPAVNLTRVPSAVGVETYAHNRLAGIMLHWRAHPFEWVEGRRWGLLRVFAGGIMRWFTIELELSPSPEGGTRVRYCMTVEPRHLLGKWIVALRMRLQRAALGRVFARIDVHACASAPLPPGEDAFEASRPLTASQQTALARKIAMLAADGVGPDLLRALGSFCANAPDQEVALLRPLAFARANALDADRVVDACLRGAHHGLFVLLWELLCPLCRVPSDFAESLRALADHGHCPSCNVDYPLDFTQSLELVFRVSPDVRTSELRTYCIGGPAFAPHVVAQMRLAPAERLSLELALGPGSYKVRSPQLPYAIAIQVSNSGRSHRTSIRLASDRPQSEDRVLLASGVQSIQLESSLDHEIVIRLERSAPREDALTAARAACLPSFRELFPTEVLAGGRLVAVGRTAFVVVHVQAQRELIRELGDARAFELMIKHREWIDSAVTGEGGAVVKSASGSTLCAFDSAAAAVRAALCLRTRIAGKSESEQSMRRLDVRLAVHQGSAVAATVDGRLDYFGLTVETAFDLLAFTTPEQVLLSAVLADDSDTIAYLAGLGHKLTVHDLAGPLGFGLQVTPTRGSEITELR